MRRSSTVRAVPSLAGVALLLILAGCSPGGDPEPGRGPLPARSATEGTAGSGTTPPVGRPTPEATASPGVVGPWEGVPSAERRFEEVTRITGGLTPKSVVASPDGHVVAQNMIYTHTVSVYDREHRKVTTIDDRITPSEFGYDDWTEPVHGGPVEASFSPDAKHVWISNYSMYGPGFGDPGDDVCSPAQGHDRSFLYRVDTGDWSIDEAVMVGSVPKYVQTTPDGRYVLVSNWCSYDVSVVDTGIESGKVQQIARIPVGRYPRGLAVTADSSKAYVAVMGSTAVKTIDLTAVAAGKRGSSVVDTFSSPGSAPRHLNLSADGKQLFVTLNGEGEVAKLDARTGRVIDTVRTGRAPRSAVLSPDGTALFVVNYESDTVSRVRTSDLKVLESRHVDHHPIGITYNPVTHEVWACSYIGVINVLADAKGD